MDKGTRSCVIPIIGVALGFVLGSFCFVRMSDYDVSNMVMTSPLGQPRPLGVNGSEPVLNHKFTLWGTPEKLTQTKTGDGEIDGTGHDFNRKLALWRIHNKWLTKNGAAIDFLPNYKNPCWLGSNGALSCLPYFYQLGVGKSGTTELYKQLVRHPDVTPPRKKENFFWATTDDFGRYVNFYKHTSLEINASVDSAGYHKKITFDATPAYFTNQGDLYSIPGNVVNHEPVTTLAHTLYALNPETRLIVTMRHPVDRLYSHYHHFSEKVFSPQDFHEHAVIGLRMMKTCLSTRTLRSCVFDKKLNSRIRQNGRIMLHYSMYYPYAREWLSVFPRSQIMFIKAEEFYKDPVPLIKEAYQFLGLDPVGPKVYGEIAEDMSSYGAKKVDTNKADGYSNSMWNSTRQMLDVFFKPYNKQMAELLGDDKWLFEKDT